MTLPIRSNGNDVLGSWFNSIKDEIEARPSESETLTNKTFDDEISIKQIATPSNPASGYNKFYPKADKKFYRLDENGNEIELGAGGGTGFNYIDDGDAESGSANYIAYADAAGNKPVDGEGGSPNITFATTATLPLRGDDSFLLTKDAVNRQGEGTARDFVLQRADSASMLSLSFDYETSVNFVDADVRIYLISSSDVFVADWNVIEPVPTELFAGSNNFKCQFQTDATDLDMRLCFHVASTNATAYTIKIDNIICGPSNYVYGSPIIDSKDFTPVVTSMGSVTGESGAYYSVGEIIHCTIDFTTGTTIGSSAGIDLPNGLTAKTSITPSTIVVGTWSRGVDDVLSAGKMLLNTASSSTTIYFGEAENEASSNPLTIAGGTSISGTGQRFSVNFKLAIAGWSSNTQLSESTLLGEVYVQVNSNGGTSLTANVTDIDWTAEDKDTAASWDGTQFESPASGVYPFDGTVLLTGSSSIGIDAYIGGVLSKRVSYAVSAQTHHFSGQIYLLKGELLSFRSTASVTLSNSGTSHALSISRANAGSQQIAASAKVEAIYTDSSGQGITHNDVITWDTKDVDTHNIMSAGVATMPKSGTVTIEAKIMTEIVTPTAGQYLGLSIELNGTAKRDGPRDHCDNATARRYSAGVSISFPVLKGETIEIVPKDSITPALALHAFGPSNYISITMD